MDSQLSRFDEHFVIREADEVKKPRKLKGSVRVSRNDANLMNAGMYILVPILMGLGVGYGADLYLHTRPVFTILFLLAGTVSAFYNMFKLTKQR